MLTAGKGGPIRSLNVFDNVNTTIPQMRKQLAEAEYLVGALVRPVVDNYIERSFLLNQLVQINGRTLIRKMYMNTPDTHMVFRLYIATDDRSQRKRGTPRKQ